MKNALAIIGADVLGQHIAHYAKLEEKFTDIMFFDDSRVPGTNNNYGEIKGGISGIDKFIKEDKIQCMLIGIGYKHMERRRSLYEQFASQICFPNIIHPSCYVDSSTLTGKGNIFLPGCIVDKGCILGSNNFFNPGSLIAHDNIIGDHNYFGPGIKTSGSVKIGSCCFFGTGTNFIDEVTIGDNINTGAGTLITKSIFEQGTYAGIPGRKIKKSLAL